MVSYKRALDFFVLNINSISKAVNLVV